MSVFRIEKNKNYTVMSNHHLRNKELSLKSKGLLSLMLSLPGEPTENGRNYNIKPIFKIVGSGFFYRLDPKSPMCPYLQYHNVERCPFFVPIKESEASGDEGV